MKKGKIDYQYGDDGIWIWARLTNDQGVILLETTDKSELKILKKMHEEWRIGFNQRN